MKSSMKNERGITVISVIVIVIILIILASIATVSGVSTVRFARYMAFKTELQMLQNEVNSLQQGKSDEDLKKYGVEMTDSQKSIFSVSEVSTILNEKSGDIDTIKNGFYYFSQDYITNDLGIDEITRDYYINLKERIIIATEPVEYNDVSYYMLEQMGDGAYNVQYNAQTGDVSFEVKGEFVSGNKGRITISNVVYDGYIDKWEAEYKLSGEDRWYRAGEFTGDTYTFDVPRTGTFEVRIVHGDELESSSISVEIKGEPTIYDVAKEEREVTNNGYTAKIPADFAVVPGCSDISKGLVISDVSNDTNDQGNQYVWIPVDGILEENGTIDDVTGSEKKILLGRYKFADDGTPSKYSGNYSEETQEEHTYNNETATDINGFIQSVRDNKGYYIARYEAGVTGYDASNVIKTNSESNPDWTGYSEESKGSLKLVSKLGAQAWNYVTQVRASKLCQNLYSGIKSDLINTYAWDTAILFIQKYSGDSDYPMQTGYSTTPNALQSTGKGVLEATGEADKRCNIYDMAGNCMEWVTETFVNADGRCVYRGGNYNNSSFYTSYRNNNAIATINMYRSFRPILYF